ncbi:MAG TPA: hypothetical protein VFJ16_18560 [Longimicrobium sp.]|nr:hypothetical protein [Longimicrobium sp.]
MLNRLRLCLLLPLAACAPVVTHGPRVEPGAELVVTAGAPRPFCGDRTNVECNAGLIPTWGAGLRYGITSRDPAGPALLAGLSVPVVDPVATEIDAYAQGPSPGAWAWGGGALWSPRHLMPYAQVGRMPAGGGPGWYVTMAYAHLYRDPSEAFDQTDDGGDEMVRPPRYWAPGAAVRARRGGSHYILYAQGAFGSYRKRESRYDPATGEGIIEDVRRPVSTVLFGVTWAIPFGELRLPSPLGRRRPAPPPIPVPH